MITRPSAARRTVVGRAHHRQSVVVRWRGFGGGGGDFWNFSAAQRSCRRRCRRRRSWTSERRRPIGMRAQPRQGRQHGIKMMAHENGRNYAESKWRRHRRLSNAGRKKICNTKMIVGWRRAQNIIFGPVCGRSIQKFLSFFLRHSYFLCLIIRAQK